MILAIALYLLGGLVIGLGMVYGLRGGLDDWDLALLTLFCMVMWPMFLIAGLVYLLVSKMDRGSG